MTVGVIESTRNTAFYPISVLAAITKALVQRGFTVSNPRVERPNGSSYFIAASIFVGPTRIGEIRGRMGHMRIRYSINLSIYSLMPYCNEMKYSACRDGRPKIRSWAVFAAKNLKIVVMKELVGDVERIMEC